MLPATTTMNVNRAASMVDLSKEFFVMNDDTSNTMSDDASLSDGSYSDSDSDSDDEADFMDISAVQNLKRSSRSVEAMQSCSVMSPSRSTVSLNALIASSQPLSQPPRTLSKHASVVNLAAPMKAIQRVSAQACSPGDVPPNEYLCKILETELDQVPCDLLGDYFLKTTPEHIAAWNGDLVRAVRTQAFDRIKEMHREGKPLQASNQFGESVLHVCVRRGTPEILNYLLREGGVSPRVHCENGRTPLHDAFWTFNGDEQSIKMTALLLKQCPEMLLIKDKRGFTPLHYVPRSQWESCYKFLSRCLPLLSKLRNNGRGGAAA